MAEVTQPSTTLYVNNLNDSLTKDELRAQLYALFTTYGKLIDVIAMKGPKMKGQAFLVFSELAAATTAMRALEGMVFYDKPLVRRETCRDCVSVLNGSQRVQYAKTKSHATSRKEDPNFVPPAALRAHGIAEKRPREDDAGGERQSKKERTEGGDDDEMELDDDS
jgi:U2 small nuclear ribonucleoprotein B''